jgi:hypothetical protein
LNYNVRTGDSVINIGCSHGETPTLRVSRVTAINKFLAPPHLIVAGQPVQGRSGGGLFTNEGFLVGVCNAADPADDNGMYAALAPIHAELDRMGLAEMCLEETEGDNGNVPLATREPPPMADQMPSARGVPAPATLLPTSDDDSAGGAELAGESLTPAERATLAEIRNLSEDAEVICSVRPLSAPRAKSEIIVLDQASPQFLRQLSFERRAARERNLTSQRIGRASPKSAPRPELSGRDAATRTR